MQTQRRAIATFLALVLSAVCSLHALADQPTPLPEDRAWMLPAKVPHPAGNEPNAARVALGKALFFDPRLSGDKTMSCTSCHNPSLGWSDAIADRSRVQREGSRPRHTLDLQDRI